MEEHYSIANREAVPALGHFPREAETTGTTLVAVECADGIVCATDSRTSSGSLIVSRATDKITQVNKHMVILRAGSAADSQAIADIVMYYAEANSIMEEEPLTVYRVAQYSRKFHYNYREQLECTAIVAGYDEVYGGQIYAIPMGGYATRQPFYTTGSGSAFIMDYVSKNWREGMDAEQARVMLMNAVYNAQQIDGASGGVIHTAVITKDGTSRKTFRPDGANFPTNTRVKAYPNLPAHIPQAPLPQSVGN